MNIKSLSDVGWVTSIAFRKTNRTHSILVAEDDGDTHRLNTEILIGSGYNVDAAQDGAVAWEILQLKSYHLLITSHEMPGMSGIELVKKARAARMDFPVIIVTGTMPENEVKHDSSLQIYTTLFKPYDIANLLKTVKEVLRATVSVRA